MAIRTTPGIAAFQEVASKINPTTNSAPSYSNSGGVLRLQAVLNNRRYAKNGNNPAQIQQSITQVNQDSSTPQNNSVTSTYQNEAGFPVGAKLTNDGNLYIAQDALGYTTPMDAEEQIKLAAKYADKNMERDAAISGVASLQNAFGKTGGFSTVFGSYTPR
jgi:hypothetical protein